MFRLLAIGAFALMSALPSKAQTARSLVSFYDANWLPAFIPGSPFSGPSPEVRFLAIGGIYPYGFRINRGFAGIDASLDSDDFLAGTCVLILRRYDVPVVAGQTQIANAGYFAGSPPQTVTQCDSIALVPPRWQFSDRATFQAPIRRNAIDGSPYEASPMVIERDGVPWITYFMGYRLGRVASESNWLASNLSRVPQLADWPTFPSSQNNFELAKLPPPVVEGEALEYYQVIDPQPNSPDALFTYSFTREEQAAIERSGLWKRTGRSFKTGGYLPVCRFDGSQIAGVTARFFSASDTECAALLRAPGLAFKDEFFRASLPIPATGACPAGSVGLSRFFNNGPARGRPANHRYMVAIATNEPVRAPVGWINEGVVMCVPQ